MERSTAWPAALGVHQVAVPNHYTALLELAGETEETAAQIEKDLPRTFGRDVADTPGLMAALKRVLTAYAAHAPDVGYVQAMNFIAAFLLLAGVPEEDAFWCLVVVVHDVVPGYFEEGMKAARADQLVFAALVQRELPAVGLHLALLAPDNIVCGIIASQWLLTLFVNVLPRPAALALWDVLAEQRSRVALFAGSLALLEAAQDDIVATTEMGECIELLQGLGGAVPDGDAFGESVRRWAGRLSVERLDELAAWETGAAESLHARLRAGIGSPRLVADEAGGDLVAESEAEAEGLLAELSLVHELAAEEVGILGGAEAEELAERMLAADRALRATALLVRAPAREAVKAHALRPLVALQTAEIAALAAEVEEAQESFQLAAQRALAAGSKGLAWERGTLWSAWEDGPYEAAFAEAEVLLETVDVAWEAIAELCAAQLSPSNGGEGDGAGHEASSAASASGFPKLQALIERAASANVSRSGPDVAALRTTAEATATAARADAPVLKVNHEAALAALDAEERAAHEAVAAWSAATATCRQARAARSLAVLRTRVSEAIGAIDIEDDDDDDDDDDDEADDEGVEAAPAAPAPRSLPDEQAGVNAALDALNAASETLRRRRARLEREAELAAAAERWHRDHVTTVGDLRSCMEATAHAANATLAARLDGAAIANVEEGAAAVERLVASVGKVTAGRLQGWLALLRESLTFGCIQYVTLIDSACEIITELSEQLTPQIRAELSRTESGPKFEDGGGEAGGGGGGGGGAGTDAVGGAGVPAVSLGNSAMWAADASKRMGSAFSALRGRFKQRIGGQVGREPSPSVDDASGPATPLEAAEDSSPRASEAEPPIDPPAEAAAAAPVTPSVDADWVDAVDSPSSCSPQEEPGSADSGNAVGRLFGRFGRQRTNSFGIVHQLRTGAPAPGTSPPTGTAPGDSSTGGWEPASHANQLSVRMGLMQADLEALEERRTRLQRKKAAMRAKLLESSDER